MTTRHAISDKPHEPDVIPRNGLVAAILTALITDNQRTTTSLIDGLQAENDRMLNAIHRTLATVRTLLDGDYMPTPMAIERAMLPLAAFEYVTPYSEMRDY